MIDYNEIVYDDKKVFKKKGKNAAPISDTIYTFDIETTSLFKINNKWQSFNYNMTPDEYKGIEKAGVPYVWMFGVNDVVYYGREFYEFELVLLRISDKIVRKIIWVHNLSFEMGWLPEILKHYTIEHMLSRDLRKPISFLIKELNIEFRCSYMLTNLSLAKAAAEFTDVEKQVGDLDYNLARGVTTPLTDTEKNYMKYDIICLYKIILHYRKKWGHLALIPYTATGEARHELNKRVDYFYHVRQWNLVPNYKQYLQLIALFMGGYTHANMLNSNKVFSVEKGDIINSYDISSSYPASMLLYKYPSTPFKKYNYDRYQELLKLGNHLFYFHVKLTNVKSRYYNNYISFSKAFNKEHVTVDNGRIAAADSLEIYVTDIDLEIIKINYDCNIEYIEIYGSYARYLDKRVLHFLIDLYKGKTTLKGIEEKEDIYKAMKAVLNACFGMSTQNPIKNNSFYDSKKGWYKKDFTKEFVEDILENQKHSYSNLFFYAVGCWVTAYSRRAVYLNLLKIDRDSLYTDTDSIKYKGEHKDIFDDYNKYIVSKYNELIDYDPTITMDDLMPADKSGKKHPIGFFECETDSEDTAYLEFITLGAKKYAYRDKRGLHITVSGVNKKSGVLALHDDINNFKKGLVFNYEEANKLIHYYNDDQQALVFYDYLGNRQICKQKYSVVLQPTTYTLGISDIYESLLKQIDMEGDIIHE